MKKPIGLWISLAAFAVALHIKGESVAELTALASVMRDRAVAIKAPTNALDTCGTGKCERVLSSHFCDDPIASAATATL